MRVCIFEVRHTLLVGISIVYLNLGKILDEYTMRVCIFEELFFTYRDSILMRVGGRLFRLFRSSLSRQPSDMFRRIFRG